MAQSNIKFRAPEIPKRKKQHTYLRVDEYGQVKPIRWFKFWMTVWMFLLIAAMAAAGGLYFLYQLETDKNRQLEDKLNLLEKQMKSLQNQTNVPLVPKPELGNEINKTKPDNTKPDKTKPEIQNNRSEKKENSLPLVPKPEPENEKKPEPENEKLAAANEITIASDSPKPVQPDKISDNADDTVITDASKTESPSAEKNTLADEIPSESEPQIVQPEVIAVENFDVSYRQQGKRMLRVNFTLRNIAPGSDSISGHTIVVLKTSSSNQRRWLVMPSVELVNGKPTGKETGESFGISNYKPIRLEAETRTRPSQFKTATVFIFTPEGEPLLEKDFPIEEISEK